MILLHNNILIEKLGNEFELEDSGLFVEDEPDSLPKARVMGISSDVAGLGLIQVGDEVLYNEPRIKGRVRVDGKEMFIIPFATVVCVL